MLDRIDIQIEVPAVDFKEQSSQAPGATSSDMMREDVLKARACQPNRLGDQSQTRYNAQMSSRQVRQFCKLNVECLELLNSAVNDMGLLARAHDKILRVSRTIADLEQSELIQADLA